MASANTVEVRKPIVTIPGELTDSIEYNAVLPVRSAFSGSPSIGYSAHEAGGDRVENPNASEIIQKIAEAQNLMFQPPTSNVVNIVDGSGNFVMFTGYATGPHHSILFGGVSNGKSIVHRCSRLAFINTSIYRPGRGQPPVAAAIDILAGASNPCAALKLILKEIIKEFLDTTGEEEGTTDYKIRQKIHEFNTKIIEEEWYPILDASTESSIPNFSDAASNPTIQLKMYDSIRGVYLSGASDFSVIISQFESMFQIMFVPGHMGTEPGKFIPVSAILSNPEDKEVNIVSMVMNPGPKKFLSVTGIAVKGAPLSEPPPVGQAVMPAGTDMICWPEELPAAGLTEVIQMPAWLPEDLYPLEIPKSGKTLDFNSNLTAVKAAQEEILDASALVHKICLDIARLTYNYTSLEQASASITSPLDVSWELGKRYTIKQPNKNSEGSSVLFSGFLNRVIHRISSSPSKAEASTQLTFSHVEANGFTLPNK